jgi:hypothetical protein
MKLSTVSGFLLAIVSQSALFLAGCGLAPAPQSGITGKWKNADGIYVVEFLPSGNCSAHYRMQGREVGGACTYTVDKDDITIRYPNMQAGAPNNSATWHYSLAGDVLTVNVLGNSMSLQRVH